MKKILIFAALTVSLLMSSCHHTVNVRDNHKCTPTCKHPKKDTVMKERGKHGVMHHEKEKYKATHRR